VYIVFNVYDFYTFSYCVYGVSIAFVFIWCLVVLLVCNMCCLYCVW